MAESTLTLNYDTLKVAVAQYLGYGRTLANWTTDQANQMDDVIQRGLRQFYFPKTGHIWSFLKPTTSLALVANDWDYTMPDDFGGIATKLHYSSNEGYYGIEIVPETKILEMRQRFNTQTGRPFMAAIRQLISTTSSATPPVVTTYPGAATSSRYEAIFFPTPDSSYTLYYSYHLLMNKLVTSTNPFFYGGMIHSEAILESCLSVAEMDINDNMGIHNQKFNELLEASMQSDMQRMNPRSLGYNGDRSDRQIYNIRTHSVTYEGNVIE